MANELVQKLTNEITESSPKELISTLSNEETAVLRYIIEQKMAQYKEEADKRLFQTTLNEIRWSPNLFNDGCCGYRIYRGSTKVIEDIEKRIDYEQAIKFAKEHNFYIPMTKPEVDYKKLEEQEWFQQNVNKWEIKKPVKKTVKSYNRMVKIK